MQALNSTFIEMIWWFSRWRGWCNCARVGRLVHTNIMRICTVKSSWHKTSNNGIHNACVLLATTTAEFLKLKPTGIIEYVNGCHRHKRPKNRLDFCNKQIISLTWQRHKVTYCVIFLCIGFIAAWQLLRLRCCQWWRWWCDNDTVPKSASNKRYTSPLKYIEIEKKKSADAKYRW